MFVDSPGPSLRDRPPSSSQSRHLQAYQNKNNSPTSLTTISNMIYCESWVWAIPAVAYRRRHPLGLDAGALLSGSFPRTPARARLHSITANYRRCVPMSRRKPDPVTGELQLTYRERIFINEYIKNGGNGKEAAIAAGYGAARADQSAYQVLHRIQVHQQIQERISESDVCANEVIGTLASFMRGNIADLLDDDCNFDLALVKERGLGHLLKTITCTTREIKTEPGQPLR